MDSLASKTEMRAEMKNITDKASLFLAGLGTSQMLSKNSDARLWGNVRPHDHNND